MCVCVCKGVFETFPGPVKCQMLLNACILTVCVCLGVFETLPGPVQCQMLLKATEQCFNTLEKAEMHLLLLKRFPESVVQHGVSKHSTHIYFLIKTYNTVCTRGIKPFLEVQQICTVEAAFIS